MLQDTAHVSLTSGPRTLWAARLAVATAAVFFISLAFPVVAGLSKNTASFPKWWGGMDVGIAFVLGILAIVLLALARGQVKENAEDSTYHVYRILIHGILAMLVVFFLLGDRVVWINCLTGFAWRAWLLLYCMPAWFTALRPSGTDERRDQEEGLKLDGSGRLER